MILELGRAIAVSALYQALNAGSRSAQSLTSLARTQISLGNFHDALEICQYVIGIDSHYWEAKIALADALLELGHWQQAADQYRMIAANIAPVADVCLGLGICLQRLGRLGESLEWFRQAITLDPMHPSGYCNLANSLLLIGKAEEAIKFYERALQMSPLAAVIQANLAHAYLACGRPESSLASSRRALELAADGTTPGLDIISDQAREFLGDALRSLARHKEAFHHYNALQTPEASGKALECAYFAGLDGEFDALLSKLSEAGATNVRAAAVGNFVALQRKDIPAYAFCPKPLSYIQCSNIASLFENYDAFCRTLLQDAATIDFVWNPLGNSTQGGFQSAGNLFNLERPSIVTLACVLKTCIEEYFERFQNSADHFIRRRPRDLQLTGWIVRLKKAGRQDAHIHPSGWLSGVLYLQVPRWRSNDEGAIKFRMSGWDFPPLNDPGMEKLHQPSKGDLVMFPSCLFHETVPFDLDEDRISIAFDLLVNH